MEPWAGRIQRENLRGENDVQYIGSCIWFVCRVPQAIIVYVWMDVLWEPLTMSDFLVGEVEFNESLGIKVF